MDYSNYDVEDFLCDHSFLEYCLGSNTASIAYWENFLEEHPDKTQVVNAAKRLYTELNGGISEKHFDEDFTSFKAAVYNYTQQSRPSNTPTLQLIDNRKIYTKTIVAISAIAAVLLIAFLLYFQPFEANNQQIVNSTLVNTPKGQKRTLTLPDGSQINLNGGTKIVISPGFNKTNRDIELTGEAFFQVAHNAKLPFIVHTAKFNVRVLGTIFNVRAYNTDEVYEASLLKGSVRISVSNGKHEEITLIPHQKFVYSAKTADTSNPTLHVESIDKQTISPSIAETDWTRNRLTFDDKGLEDIASTLERWYGVNITINNQAYKNYRYTSTFENDDLLHVLKILQLTNHFNYKKEGNLIIIY